MKLDPRNAYRLEQIASSYWGLGRYQETRAAGDRPWPLILIMSKQGYFGLISIWSATPIRGLCTR